MYIQYYSMVYVLILLYYDHATFDFVSVRLKEEGEEGPTSFLGVSVGALTPRVARRSVVTDKNRRRGRHASCRDWIRCCASQSHCG